MARITICDLCKKRIKDDESEQGELTLSFYVPINMVACDNSDCGAIPGVYCKPCTEQDIPQNEQLAAELCLPCTTLLRKTITGDEPLRAAGKPKKKPERFGAPAVEYGLADAYGEADEPIGPSEEEKAGREPTKELLEDEMKVVPLRLTLLKAPRVCGK